MRKTVHREPLTSHIIMDILVETSRGEQIPGSAERVPDVEGDVWSQRILKRFEHRKRILAGVLFSYIDRSIPFRKPAAIAKKMTKLSPSGKI